MVDSPSNGAKGGSNSGSSGASSGGAAENNGSLPANSPSQNQIVITAKSLDTSDNQFPSRIDLITFLKELSSLSNNRKLPSLLYKYNEKIGSSSNLITGQKSELAFKIEERENENTDKIHLYPSDLPTFLQSIFSVVPLVIRATTPVELTTSLAISLQKKPDQTEREFLEENKTTFQNQIADLLSLLDTEKKQSPLLFADIQTIRFPSYSEYFSHISDVVLPLLTAIQSNTQISGSKSFENKEIPILFEDQRYSLSDIKQYLNDLILKINHDFTNNTQKNSNLAEIRSKLSSPDFVKIHTKTIEKLKAESAEFREKTSFVEKIAETTNSPITFNRFKDAHLVFPNWTPTGSANEYDTNCAKSLITILDALVQLSKLAEIKTTIAQPEQDSQDVEGGASEEDPDELTTAELLSLSELFELTKNKSFKIIFQNFISSGELSQALQKWANLPENDALDLASIWRWINFQLSNKKEILTLKSSDAFDSSATVNSATKFLVPFYDKETALFIVSPEPQSPYSLWFLQVITEIQPTLFEIFLEEILNTLPEFRSLQTLPEEQVTPTTPTTDLATAGIPGSLISAFGKLSGVQPNIQLGQTPLIPQDLKKIENQLQLQMEFAILDQLNKQGFSYNSLNDLPDEIRRLLQKDIQEYVGSLNPETLRRALLDRTTKLQIFSEFSRRFILQQTPSSAYLAGFAAIQHKELQKNTDTYLTTTIESYIASPTPARKQSIMQRLQAMLVVTGYTPDKNQDLFALSQIQLEALLGISFSNKQLSKQELVQFIQVLQEYTDAYYYRQQFEKNLVLSQVAQNATQVQNQTELLREQKASAQFITQKNKALLEIGSFFSTRLPSQIIEEAKKQGGDPQRIAKLEALQKDATGYSKNLDLTANKISDYSAFVESLITEFLATYQGTTYFSVETLAAFLGISVDTITSDQYKKFSNNSLPILKNLLTTYVRVYELSGETISAAFRQLTQEKLINNATKIDGTGRKKRTSFGGMVPLSAPRDTNDLEAQKNHAGYVGGLLDVFGKEMPDSFRKLDFNDRIEIYLNNYAEWENKISNERSLSPWQMGLTGSDSDVLGLGFEPQFEDSDDFSQNQPFQQSRIRDQEGRVGDESTAERVARQMALADENTTPKDKVSSRRKAKSIVKKLKKSTKKAAQKKARQLANKGVFTAVKIALQMLINAIMGIVKTILIPVAIWTIGKLIALAPFIFKAALIAAAAAMVTTLVVGSMLAIAAGVKWLAQQAIALAQGVFNAGVNIFSSIANGISSIFSGGAAIPATAATVTFTSFAAFTLGNEMINDALYLIPMSSDDSLSRYIAIEKTATPSRFENGAESQIEYTIVISANDPDNYSVEISNISDKLSIDFLEDSTPVFTPLFRSIADYQSPSFTAPVTTVSDEESAELPVQSTGSITLDANNPEITLTYVQPIDSTIIDASVINTISLDLSATPLFTDSSEEDEEIGSGISESISRIETVCIGDCPQTAEIAWPSSGTITQLPFKYNFALVNGVIDLGTIKYGTHDRAGDGGRRGADGIDIAAPAGTAIYAPFDGVVLQQLPNYGNTNGVLSFGEAFGPFHVVLSRNPDGIQYVFAHNSSMSVRPGDSVKKCQIIGTVGNYGPLSTGNHLHFERGYEKNGRIFMNLRDEDNSILIDELPEDIDNNKIDATSYRKQVRSECDQN